MSLSENEVDIAVSNLNFDTRFCSPSIANESLEEIYFLN